jgi:hypothetical protein
MQSGDAWSEEPMYFSGRLYGAPLAYPSNDFDDRQNPCNTDRNGTAGHRAWEALAADVFQAQGFETAKTWPRALDLLGVPLDQRTYRTPKQLGTAERVSVTDVTPGFLTLLGVAPAYGRMFEANDLSQPLAIVTHAFWRARFLSSAPKGEAFSLVSFFTRR